MNCRKSIYYPVAIRELLWKSFWGLTNARNARENIGGSLFVGNKLFKKEIVGTVRPAENVGTGESGIARTVIDARMA